MSDEQVLEQADITPRVDAGDVPASEQEGQPDHVPVSIIPKEHDDAADEKSKSEANDEARKKRISDAEWQKRTEEAKEGKELKEQLKEKLDIEDDQDLGKKAIEQLEQLKSELALKDWEAEHPIVRTEKYKGDWKEMLEKKGHLIKSGDLTLDEAWAIINREKPSSLNKELQDRSDMERSSVPLTSRGSTPVSKLDSETARIAQVGGYTEEDFRKAGML